MNKPGYTTTEFWSTIIAQVLALIVIVRPSVITAGDTAPLVQALAVIAAAIGSSAYSASRSRVKVAAGTATVVAPGTTSGVHVEPLVQRNVR